jgi:hypothetical protein
MRTLIILIISAVVGFGLSVGITMPPDSTTAIDDPAKTKQPTDLLK